MRIFEAGTQPFGPRGERYQTKLVQRNESETFRKWAGETAAQVAIHSSPHTYFRGELYSWLYAWPTTANLEESESVGCTGARGAGSTAGKLCLLHS